MNRNPAVKARLDLMIGKSDTSPAAIEFIEWLHERIDSFAVEASRRAPAGTDVGRFIAATDCLKQARDLYCDAAKLSGIVETRKRRRAEKDEQRKAAATAEAVERASPPLTEAQVKSAAELDDYDEHAQGAE